MEGLTFSSVSAVAWMAHTADSKVHLLREKSSAVVWGTGRL